MAERKVGGLTPSHFKIISERLEALAKAVNRVERGQKAMRAAITEIQRSTEQMATDLTRLTREVSEATTEIDSAIVLINGLAQQIRDLATDPAALEALADSLDSKSNELAAAVVANTPAEVPPAEGKAPAHKK